MTGAQQPDPTAFQVLVHLNRPDLLCVICPGTARTFLHSIKAQKKLAEQLVPQSFTSFETGLPLIFLVGRHYGGTRSDGNVSTKSALSVKPRICQRGKTLGFSLAETLLQNCCRIGGLCIAHRPIGSILHLSDVNNETPNKERAMKTNRISQTKTANGIVGYDFGCRTHFETLDLASRGIAVRLNAVRGKTRYMVVTGCSTHEGAYEIARKLAPVVED